VTVDFYIVCNSSADTWSAAVTLLGCQRMLSAIKWRQVTLS